MILTWVSQRSLYQAQDYVADVDVTRVLLKPITGRSHQLRVHMQYLGHPIMGDHNFIIRKGSMVDTRMALHAV